MRDHLIAELRRLGLLDLLGRTLFPPLNWHQSLSDRFEAGPALVERLLAIGPKISAPAIRLRIDRVESSIGPDGIHWAFKPDKKPLDFDAVPRAIGSAVAIVDRRKPTRPTAHITICYGAPEPLRRMMR